MKTETKPNRRVFAAAAVLLGALLLVPVRMIPASRIAARTAESAQLNYTELRPELPYTHFGYIL